MREEYVRNAVFELLMGGQLVEEQSSYLSCTGLDDGGEAHSALPSGHFSFRHFPKFLNNFFLHCFHIY